MNGPILENILVGEDPKNLPQCSNVEYPIEQCEPLPKKYLDKLPEYIKLFCLPVVNPENKIQFTLDLTQEFVEAFKIHYNFKQTPSQNKILNILEAELNVALKGFF